MDKKYTSSINRRSPRPRSKRLREQGIGGHVSGAAVAPSGNDFGLQDSLLNFRTGVNTLLVPCDSTGAEITWEEASQLDTDGNIKAKSLKAKVALWSVESLAGKGLSGAPSSGTGGGSLFGLYTDTTWVSTPAEDDALSAVLGKSLHARVSVLEGAGYLTGITKAMVEAVLTGDITTHTHSQYLTQHQSLADYYTKSQADTRYARQAAPNNFMHSGNEMTFVPSGYSAPIWFNYQTVGGTNGAITEYRFGNGSGGAYADVRAKRFIVSGGTASQFLKADGSVDGNSYAAGVSPGGAAVWLYGKYAVESGFGGQQLPNYFGKNRVGALMMNTTINGNKQFKDFLIMDCYEGSDVGGAVAIGVNRQALGVYIMRSEATRTEWSQSAELIGTHNYASILDNRYINSDGDTMNGALQMNANQIKFGSLLYMSSVSDRLAVWSGVGGAGPLNVGNLLVSNAWADYTKVPTNGIYSKGIISSGVATGTAPFTVLSSTMVSNLNADMLDDLHAIDFARSGRVGNVDLNTITTSGIYGTGGSCANAPLHTEYGQLLVLHGQGDTPIAQLLFSYNTNGLIYTRAGSPTNTGGKGPYGAWKQLALIDSNVASATKLQTARSIWGQSFDGTSAITGNMIHVGEFRFEAGTAVLHNATTKVYQLWAVNGINLFPTWSVNTAVLSVTPNGNVGRVGVNMFSPAYDFDVTGVIHASGEIFSDKAIGGKGMTSSSDIRQKHIIGDFVMSLDDVLKMPLKRFKWLDGPDKDERIGVIAQEALKIVPQVVYIKPDGFYSVDYGALAHAEVKTVANVVTQLVERLNKLESQLNNRA